ncbi:type IV secretion protein Rhs [Salmonella enterica subsp. enterica]|nr:type IV secretion protein Rhs [Salmonella enterica subsp. enterica]MIF51081.1 type IV secretion protein Rhs [Salmonella enterica subsp. enterica]
MAINASKHFDPMLGLDFHSYIVPPSVLPTPHIAMVFDLWDYAPLIGATVKIHGLRRTVAGTEGKVFHILVGVPMPPVKVPGGPQTDDEVFMGSKTVVVDGDPLTPRMAPVLSCNVVGIIPPFRLRRAKKMPMLSLTAPLTVNMALPHHVSVGGPLTISMMSMLSKVGLSAFKRIGKSKAYKKFMEKFKTFRQKLFKNMEPGFLKCKVLRAEPVDIRDGSVRLEQRDFTLPGRVPLDWIRYYRSAEAEEEGWLGFGWKTLADTRLVYHADADYRELVLADGSLFFADTPEQAGAAHAVNSLPGGALMWYEDEDGGAVRHWFVETEENRRWRFREETASAGTPLLPDRLEDNNGNGWRFRHEDGGLSLTEYTAQGATGRVVVADSLHNRIVRIRFTDSQAYTGPDGDVTERELATYGYTAANQLARHTDSLGHSREFAWQDVVYMQYHADRLGQRFHYEYDDARRVIHAWGDGGYYDYRFEWNDACHELEMTDSLGHTTLIRFSEDGLPLCEIDPEGGATFFLYDEFGQTVGITSPGGRQTRFEYDEAGHIVREITPDGSEYTAAWQQLHLKETVDPEGSRWLFEYDDRGNLTVVTDPAGVQRQYHYDDCGQVVRRDTPGSGYERFEYDRPGFISCVTARNGAKNWYLHDNTGRLLSETDALNQTRQYRYDSENRLVQAKLPERNAVTLSYDAEGQLVSYDDGQGRITHLTYTPTGEVSGCTTPDGEQVRYEYDTEDRLVAVVNQLNQCWLLARDSLGRITQEQDWRGQITGYRWDADSLLVARTAPDGTRLAYRHDRQGRVTAEYHGDALLTRYEYDRRGLLTACDNPHRRLAWKYDAAGRLVAESQDDFLIRHSYTGHGQYAGRTGSSGHRVALGYNDAGQLHTVQINDCPPVALAYDVLGRIREEQLSPELKRELRYNDQGGLSAQTVTRQSLPLFSTQWHYDQYGNVRMRNDSASGKEFYAYDVMDRLTAHTDVLGRVTTFLYDAAGNRLREEILSRQPDSDNPEQNNNPEHAGQPGDDGWRCHAWLEDRRDIPLEHVYNRNGQMVARRRRKPGGWQREIITEHLEWDVRGQLVRLRSDTQETRYGYDGLGRRVFKKTLKTGEHTAALRWFWWEGDALMCEAEDTADAAETCTAACDIQMPGSDAARKAKLTELARGLTLREYVYYPHSFEPLSLITYRTGPDGGCGDKDPVAVYFYHNDINGAPLRLTDRTGAVVWRLAESGAWGGRSRQEGLVRNPLRFQGQYYDEESGLHYNRYRYYEPESGRYISADPIGLLGGINLYQYAPNPLSWIDPLGLAKTCQRAKDLRSKGFQEHHIISDKNKLTKNHPLLQAAGFDLQKMKNKIFLPTDGSLHKTRSIHSGKHLNDVSKNLADQMDVVYSRGQREGWSQAEYSKALDEIVANERAFLKSGERALNKNKRSWSIPLP